MKFTTFNAANSPKAAETTELAAKSADPVDTTSIDRVMRLDPLRMSDQDLDVIIAYYRKARANFESGAKPKRGVNAAGEKPDLSGVIAALTGKPKEAPKPAGSSGIRRI